MVYFPRSSLSVVRVFFAAFAILGLGLAVRAADPLPIKELFRRNGYSSAQLSPDGSHIAALHTTDKDVTNLVILDLKTRVLDTLSGDGKRDIYDFRWLDNNRIVYQDGVFNRYANAMFVVDIKKLGRQRPVNAYDVARIVGTPSARPDHVLLWVIGAAKQSSDFDTVIEITTTRGLTPKTVGVGTADNAIKVYRSPVLRGDVLSWKTDFDGEVALCTVVENNVITTHRYNRAKDSFTVIPLDWGLYDAKALDPDGRRLWVTDHAKDIGSRLIAYDLETGKFEEPIATNKTYDLTRSRIHFSPVTRKLAGFSYDERRNTSVWFDETYAQAQATVDAARPEMDNILIDVDRTANRFLYWCNSSSQPGDYLLLDIAAKSMVSVFDIAPHLAARKFTGARPISFRARDGLTMEGYLALPEGTSKESPAPLVVLAHGGPWVRDTWDFDPEVQFLVSRGYAVLQPNYRGSSGYSYAVSQAQDYEFRKMHEDVTDATKAMLRTGLIDPKRVAIMGASFGGYLAAAGVAFESDLYCCAISFAGVFDWETLIRSRRSPSPSEYLRLRKELGSATVDKNKFDAISPLAHAAKIRVPILVAHGKDDRVVDVAQSKKFVAALKAASVPHETLFLSLEGHGFAEPESRYAYYQKVEAFLAKNLAPKR